MHFCDSSPISLIFPNKIFGKFLLKSVDSWGWYKTQLLLNLLTEEHFGPVLFMPALEQRP